MRRHGRRDGRKDGAVVDITRERCARNLPSLFRYVSVILVTFTRDCDEMRTVSFFKGSIWLPGDCTERR